MKRTTKKRFKVSIEMDFYTLSNNEMVALKKVQKLEYDINKMLLTDAGSVCKLFIDHIEKLPF